MGQASYLSDTPHQDAANAAGISDLTIEQEAKARWPKIGPAWDAAWHTKRSIAREDAAQRLLRARRA